MRLFLLTFLTIYGGIHGYFFVKVRAAFRPAPIPALFLALFLVLMTTAPITVRLLERHGHDVVARILAYPAFFWMGMLFLFFSTSLVIDTARLSSFLYSHFSGHPTFHPGNRAGFLLPAAVACAVTIYGYFEALDIRSEHVTVTTEKLPAGVERLRVVQLSDVHIGLIVKEGRLRRMIEAARMAEPDLLVVTGDLLDGQPDGYELSCGSFANLQPRLGKYAVTGNHEFYVGLEEMEDFCRRGGLKLLRGEGESIGGVINIAGVDDPAGIPSGRSRMVDERQLLGALPRDRFTLLLKHRPVVVREAAGLFDLQLSGHVHKGQIFPFNLLSYIFYPVRTGLSPAGEKALLYVSRGTGTWGPPVRFLAPPEVTVIDLVRRR